MNAEVAILRSELVVLNSEQYWARNVMDAKMSGMVSSVTKEVDAKMSGIAGSVTKEVEGLSKTLEAKIATTINSAGLKAEAETLRVLSEYKVHAPPLHLHDFVALLLDFLFHSPSLTTYPSPLPLRGKGHEVSWAHSATSSPYRFYFGTGIFVIL